MSPDKQSTHQKTLLPRAMRGAVSLAAALLLMACASNHDPAPFAAADPDARGMVRATGVAYPGQSATVRGFRFQPGQSVRLSSGGQDLLEAPIQISEEGGFEARFAIPQDTAPGIYPVVVQASDPVAAQVLDFKISAPVALSGAELFDTSAQQLRPGLYQGAWSPRSNAVFVAASSGRPPEQQSALMKVDPQSLQIIKAVGPTTAATPGQPAAQAAFGIGVDDDAGTVWVTNTTNNSVAVYTQKELALIKQFPEGTANHAREVAIDSARHRAYVSTGTSPYLVVIDTQKLEPIGRIELQSPKLTREQPASMALALDAAGDKLYVASRTTNEIYQINLAAQAVERVIGLPDARGVSGVAVAPEQGLLFVASQDSDSLHIIDLQDGSIQHRLTIGAGPLSVVWEPTRQLAYVSSRGSDSIAVVDAQGQILAQLDGGSFPNHVFTDGQGHVFALNKARGSNDEQGDFIRRIQRK